MSSRVDVREPSVEARIMRLERATAALRALAREHAVSGRPVPPPLRRSIGDFARDLANERARLQQAAVEARRRLARARPPAPSFADVSAPERAVTAPPAA